MMVNVAANCAELYFDLTLSLRTLTGNEMQLTVLDGMAYIAGLGITVPTGYTVFAPLDDSGTCIAGQWRGLRALRPREVDDYTLQVRGRT